MSVHITKPVWLADIQPQARKLVALRIADGANDSGVCWPSVGSIARACGMGERMTRRHIATLEEEGWITRVSTERPNGSSSTNEYHWNLEKLDQVEDADRLSRTSNKAPTPRYCGTPSPRYSSTPSPGTTVPPPPVPQYRPSEPSVEPSDEPSVNTCPQGGRGMAAAAEDIAEPEPPDDSPSEQLPFPPPPVPRPPSKRPANPVFDAVAEAWGVSSAQTKTSGSLIGKAVSEIRAIYPGLSNEDLAAEVRRRAQNYRLKFPDCDCTPSALIKHWPTLNVAAPRRTPARTSDALPGMIRETNLRPKMINLNPPTP